MGTPTIIIPPPFLTVFLAQKSTACSSTVWLQSGMYARTKRMREEFRTRKELTFLISAVDSHMWDPVDHYALKEQVQERIKCGSSESKYLFGIFMTLFLLEIPQILPKCSNFKSFLISG